MTRTGGRGIRILDGAETAVAAARVAVISATRSAFHRGLAQTAPRFSLCSLTPSSPPRPSRSFQDAFNHATPDAGAHCASRAAIG